MMWIGWKKGHVFTNVETGARLQVGKKGIIIEVPGQTPKIVVRWENERNPDEEWERIFQQLALKKVILWCYD